MNVKASWEFDDGREKKMYCCEKQVLVRSQPVREYKTEELRSKEYKSDDEITEKLDRMQSMIIRNSWFDELGELYAHSILMVRYYDSLCGYDKIQVYQVLGSFREFLENRQATLEKIAAIDNNKAGKDKDDIMHELAFRARSFDGWGGICARIGLAVVSCGATEIILMPLDIVKSGVDYVDNTPKEKQTNWGKLWAGVKPIAYTAAFAAGGHLVGKSVPIIARYTSKWAAGSKLLPTKLKSGIIKISRYFDDTAEGVEKCDPRKLKSQAAAAENSMEQAAKQGEATIEAIYAGMSKDMTQLEKLKVLAQQAGNKEGAELIEGLKAVIDNYRLSGKAAMTEGALKDQIVKMCRNKYAIEQMIRQNPGQADAYRKLFTKYRAQFLYEPIKQDSRRHIADMLGCSVDDIQIKSVSGNSSEALEKGMTIGHDLDVTFIYKSKDGKTLIELPQAIAEDALYKTGCKKAGFNFKSFNEAKEFAESMQLHACQPSDAERLPEVQKIIDKYFRTARLDSASVPKFRNAEVYKTLPMYEKGAAKIQQACPTEAQVEKCIENLNNIIKNKTAAGESERAVIDGVGDMLDTFRAAFKGGDLVKGKGIGAETVRGTSGLNEGFHRFMALCDKVKSGRFNLVEGEKVLKSMKTDMGSALNDSFSQMETVNDLLGKGLSGSSEGIGAGFTAGGTAVMNKTQDR